MKRDTLILGLGNPLMADDGAGIQVVEMLMERTLPAGIKVRTAARPAWGWSPRWKDSGA